MTAKTLETAMSKAIALPEAAQEQIGRELIARIDALEQLKSELRVGLDQLDAGMGEDVDIEDIIQQANREHAEK